MHVATIFLLILVLVLVAFLVNGAIVTRSLSRWRCYEHCFSPPPDSTWIFTERKRQAQRGRRLSGLTIGLGGFFLFFGADQSQAAGLVIGGVIMALSSIPISQAMGAFLRAEDLNEAELRLYKALGQVSSNRLARAYLDAVRESGRGWVTKVECQRLRDLVREDELRATRRNCLSGQRNDDLGS